MLFRLIHLSKDWNTLKNEGERNDFFDKKLILGEYERIDMKNEGYIRAFFCLALVEGDKADLFEKEIINECISNEKYKCIQSIYKTKGFANLTWHYVLDIVAFPHKLFNTLIKIYKKSEEFDIDITSNTYIVVEHLTQGMFTGPIEELIDVDNVNEEDLSIVDLIEKGESSRIEFKSSLKWDYKAKSAIKDREFDVLRTIAGFANSEEGGYLLVGIRDNKDILGIEKDFPTLGRKKDIDGFELHLFDIIKEHLGPSALMLLNIVFEKIEGKTLCKLKVRPSHSDMPIYLSRNKQDEFFVRMGNSTKQLGLRETLDYIGRRFPDA